MLQAVRRGGVYVCVDRPHATKGASKFRVRMATDCNSCRANKQVIHASKQTKENSVSKSEPISNESKGYNHASKQTEENSVSKSEPISNESKGYNHASSQNFCVPKVGAWGARQER